MTGVKGSTMEELVCSLPYSSGSDNGMIVACLLLPTIRLWDSEECDCQSLQHWQVAGR